MKIEKLSPECVKDLIPLINSLGSLEKTASVEYGKTKFAYVPLDDMLSKIKENQNFAFMQPLGMLEDGTPCIQCVLIHKSGECITSDPYRLIVKPSERKQEEGSEITYSRRYTMASFFGIASNEDNDANNQKPQKTQPLKIFPVTAKKINPKIDSFSFAANLPIAEIIKNLEAILKKNIKLITENEAVKILAMPETAFGN